MTSVADFDFDLPDDLIAQHPRPRGTSRLLVVDRAGGLWHEHSVSEVPDLLVPGDLIVANDTRVFPARLLGVRDPSGGAAECLLMEAQGDDEWLALVHPGQKLKTGARLKFTDEERAPGVCIRAEILEQRFFGRRRVRLTADGATSVQEAIERIGHIPLPPYIRRPDTAEDRERYQTVYARATGSIAAPTAGLHFDDALVTRVRERGIEWAAITLHVGYGTFKPVRVEDVEAHQVDAESFEVSDAAAAAIDRARGRGRHVVAVGTTTVRALESAAIDGGRVRTGAARTELFLRPGSSFQVVDALLTNFHLPRSSLLMLVAAFGGRELIMDAYRHAVREGFRFYSYGDAMLVR